MNQQQFSPRGFNILPPVVKNLLIINVLVFAAQFTAESVFKVNLNDYLAMHYWGSSKFNPAQLVTYMFLHGSPGHIFFNMFALWMFGNTLENVWGGKRFLTYFMITGIGAALIHMLVMWIGISNMQAQASLVMQNPNPESFLAFIKDYRAYLSEFQRQNINLLLSEWPIGSVSPEFVNKASNFMNELITARMDVPTVGASGAVFGILLAFGMMFPNSVIYLYMFLPIKAKWFVIGYGAVELILGVVDRSGDNVAHFAHLGGMIFGFIMIKLWNKKIQRFN